MDIIIVPIINIIWSIIKLSYTIILADVILSWLLLFNVININNRVIYIICDFVKRSADLIISPIRSRFNTIVGNIDLSPLIAMLTLMLLEQMLFRISLRFSSSLFG